MNKAERVLQKYMEWIRKQMDIHHEARMTIKDPSIKNEHDCRWYAFQNASAELLSLMGEEGLVK